MSPINVQHISDNETLIDFGEPITIDPLQISTITGDDTAPCFAINPYGAHGAYCYFKTAVTNHITISPGSTVFVGNDSGLAVCAGDYPFI